MLSDGVLELGRQRLFVWSKSEQTRAQALALQENTSTHRFPGLPDPGVRVLGQHNDSRRECVPAEALHPAFLLTVDLCSSLRFIFSFIFCIGICECLCSMCIQEPS